MAALKCQFEKTLNDATESQKFLEEDLVTTKHDLLKVQDQLSTAQKVRYCHSGPAFHSSERQILSFRTSSPQLRGSDLVARERTALAVFVQIRASQRHSLGKEKQVTLSQSSEPGFHDGSVTWCCCCSVGAGEEVSADSCLPQHERDSHQEE